MQTTENKILYRDYRDSDDEACKALEMRAMQGSRFPQLQRVLSFFVKAGFTHLVSFDAKAKQYGEYVIRVAEDPTASGRIVGAGCAVLKQVCMHAQDRKIGYVFDLRVDQSYQGYGIGKTLSKQIEAFCLEKGAEYLYLSVNSDNVKAKTMYANAGFVHASFRSPALSMLVNSKTEDNAVPVRVVPAEEAMELTRRAFKDCDLTLCDLAPLFQSRLYEGTYMASSGSSHAGVSCWNGNAITGFRVDRIVLPISWWCSVPARTVGMALLSSAVLLWARMLQTSFAGADTTEAYLWLVGKLAITSAGLIIAWRCWPLLSFIVDKISTKDAKLKHRLFGPFGSGPIESQVTLMRAVLKKVHNIARADGYAMSLCNMDRDDPLRTAFASSKFYTLFMQKKLTSVKPGLTAASTDIQDVPPLSASNFFDPRDI